MPIHLIRFNFALIGEQASFTQAICLSIDVTP